MGTSSRSLSKTKVGHEALENTGVIDAFRHRRVSWPYGSPIGGASVQWTDAPDPSRARRTAEGVLALWHYTQDQPEEAIRLARNTANDELRNHIEHPGPRYS